VKCRCPAPGERGRETGVESRRSGTPTPIGAFWHPDRMASASEDRPRSKERSKDERIDSGGENQKAARRNLPLKRARIQRAYRHAVKAELSLGEDAEPGAVRRKEFRKWKGPIRRDHLDRQLARRHELQVDPRRSEEARGRRKSRRGDKA
jgi:hypothetical protein